MKDLASMFRTTKLGKKSKDGSIDSSEKFKPGEWLLLMRVVEVWNERGRNENDKDGRKDSSW